MNAPLESKDRELFCCCGHLIARNGRLICLGSGHGDDREIDLAEFVREAVTSKQLDLNSILYGHDFPSRNVLHNKPPRHEQKLLFTLDPSAYPNDDHVVGAGIGPLNQVWVVSGWVADDVKKVPRKPQPDSLGLRLRFEGADEHLVEGGFFGPYMDVGCVCFTAPYVSYITHEGYDFKFYLVRISQDPTFGGIDPDVESLTESQLPREYSGALSNLSGLLPNSMSKLRREMGLYVSESEELWIPKSATLPAHNESQRTCMWQIRPGNEEDPRVALETRYGDWITSQPWLAGPAWDYIHAVRMCKLDERKHGITYVAQRGQKIYKVSVAF